MTDSSITAQLVAIARLPTPELRTLGRSISASTRRFSAVIT